MLLKVYRMTLNYEHVGYPAASVIFRFILFQYLFPGILDFSLLPIAGPRFSINYGDLY